MSEALYEILANASLSHMKKCWQQLQELNLSTGQPKVLAALLGREGIVQKELAAICHVEPSTMTSLLQNMQRNGLIEKKPLSIPGGKRAYGIYLTDKGRSLGMSAELIMDNMERLAFQDFTDEERETFLKLIRRLTNNLS